MRLPGGKTSRFGRARELVSKYCEIWKGIDQSLGIKTEKGLFKCDAVVCVAAPVRGHARLIVDRVS